MAVQDYKINYKSDFVLTINGDAGWAVPFCIKFWTGMPSQAYFVGFDGVKYINCRVGDTPTQLLVMFDDHHLPIGKLMMQIAYHTTIEEFPGSVFDEVTNARDVIVTIDGTDYQVLLDFTGEDAPELEFDLPAYANEAERIQNELQRQQNEADRIAAELQREQATADAVQGAENVNAQLNGTTLTVTNRQGVSTSVNTKGEQGAQGPVGPEGPQGEQGPKGEKGDTGATGPQGIQGPAGPQGQTGVSITDFVKTGETETDTLYDIEFSDDTTKPVAIPKGEKGDQGDQGPEGPQGPMGDVAVITPEQQAAFTMYGETGQNTNGPMTQKAVTDALNKIAASSVSYNNSQSGLAAENVQGALDEALEFKGVEKVIIPRYLETKDGFLTSSNTWLTPNSIRANTHKSIPVVAGELYKITANSEKVTTYAFLQSDQVPSTNQQPIDLVAGTSVTSIGVGETKYIQIPTGCTYLALNEANVTGENRLPAVFCKMELSVLNEKVGELDFRIDDVTEFDTIPIPYDIKVYISPVLKQWLSGNNNYTGSFIWVQDSSLNYKITANTSYNTRVVALTANTYTSGEVCDTFATGDYDTSEFCVNAGETRIVKFPAATKFLWVSFTEGSGVNTTPQYVGVEKTFESNELNDEVCIYNGSTQAVLEIPCQITAGDILHIEVDKGDTAPYTSATTKYNDVVQEYLDYLCPSDVDKYIVAKYNADVIIMFSSVAASSFKVSKVQASLLKDIEFSETCNNIVEVSIQNGTPVPYYLINASGQWVTGAQYKSYILDIPDGVKSMYIIPHGSCSFTFLNSNTIPVSTGIADLFDGIPRITVNTKTEYIIPNGCKYVAFTYYFYNNRIVTDASPIYLGFRFGSVDFLNKYKLAQPYSSLGLENMHLIIAAETLYQNNTDKTHSEDLSILWPWIVRTKHANALGKYYLYFSEDHTQDSPIYMSYSDNLLDWTYYGIVATELGLLGTAGDIECPCVIWDDFNSRYLLYTHALGDIAGVGYAQTEFICESTDGINWTYVKPFVTIPKDRFVGNFHNGYVRIQKDGGRWYAQGLIGGGDAGQATDYYSYDGLNWVVNPKQTCPKNPMCLPNTNGNPTDMREIVLRGGDFFVIDGKHYYINNGGTSASGTDERVARIYIQETLDDNRTCLGKAYPLTYENQAIRTVTSFMDDSGEVYVMLAVKYTPFNANHKRPFYIFIAKLKKN